jgi:hypothetical protein
VLLLVSTAMLPELSECPQFWAAQEERI